MFQQAIDDQYRCPSGLLGRIIGKRMVRDHEPENLWTISLLEAQAHEHILELGFGAGFAIQQLAEVVTEGRIAGIDFSQTMVRAARRRNAEAVRGGQVALFCGDAASLPFADHSFDTVFSIHSIYFWPQPLDALAEAHRVLKPGGSLVLTILPKARWNEDDPDMPVGTPDCTPYSGRELKEILVEAGFHSAEIQADSNPVHRSNFSVIGKTTTNG